MADSSTPEDPPKTDVAPSKAGRGRPPLPKGTRKEFMLRVRMMTSLRDALDEAAKKENKTASEFVRELVEKRLGLR